MDGRLFVQDRTRCPGCGQDLGAVACHTFLFRYHWPEHVDTELVAQRCARCCDHAHRLRKPRGRPRPAPPACCVCGRRPPPGTEAVHVTHVTNVPFLVRDGRVDREPNQCHEEQLYCATCAFLALHSPAEIAAAVARDGARAWAHPGPHPTFESARPPRKAAQARALWQAELEQQQRLAGQMAAMLMASAQPAE